jgi:carboxymethylenebutenolidase
MTLNPASHTRFRTVPEAGHAFNADYRPSYVKSAAEAGWKEATGWLKAHGV